jgi:imidazole glycerol-phosphate synthase subunit HisH
LNTKICILDYGSGNVASVRNSFDRLGLESYISNEAHDIVRASHLVLPGVGAFKASMEKIEKELPLDVINLCLESALGCKSSRRVDLNLKFILG